MLVHLFYGGLVLTYLLFSDLIKLTFRPGHLLINESFTTREVSFEYYAEELGNALTFLANLEESGTGIRHEVGLAVFGTAINGGAAPTYINLIFALSLMGDMPTNKARTSDNAQKQSSICPKSNSFLFCFILFFLFVLQSLFLFTCQSAFNLLYIFCWRKVLWNYTTLHKHISNSSIVGNMLLAYTTFSLKVFGLYILSLIHI